MAAPTIRATGAVLTGTTASLSPVNPTHDVGDLLLCVIGSANNASNVPVINTPSGWTPLVTPITAGTGAIRGAAGVFAKRAASAAEASPAFTGLFTGTSNHHAARVVSITAGTWNDSGTLTEAWEDVTTGSSLTASVNLTGLATTDVDRLCVAHLFQADNVASGLTNDGSYLTAGSDSDSPTGCDGYLGTRYREQASAGTAGATFSFTSGGTSAPCLGIAFAIIPNASVPVPFDVPAAQATADAGGVAFAASVPVAGAEATTEGGGSALLVGLALPFALAACSAGGALITAPPTSGPQIGTVTYPTTTTWECVITELEEGPNVFDVSDGTGSTSVTVTVGAVPHTLRAEAAGAPDYATVYPGADGVAASATSSAGGVSLVAALSVPFGTATTSAGGVLPNCPLRSATATTTGGGIGILGATLEHVLRVEAGGLPDYATVVPGADGQAGTATTAAGGAALSAAVPTPAAQASATAGGISGAYVGIPGASATTSSGSITLSASLGLGAGTATTAAGGIAQSIPVPNASATTDAGGASLAASVPAAGAEATTSAGGVTFGEASLAPAASATTEGGGLGFTASVPVEAATATASAAGITAPLSTPRTVDVYADAASVGGVADRYNVGISADRVTVGLMAKRGTTHGD